PAAASSPGLSGSAGCAPGSRPPFRHALIGIGCLNYTSYAVPWWFGHCSSNMGRVTTIRRNVEHVKLPAARARPPRYNSHRLPDHQCGWPIEQKCAVWRAWARSANTVSRLRRVGAMPTFSLLTLNCFGVPTPTTHPRLLALARELNARDDQIVCLQEVQSHAYRRLLMRACDSYPHAAYAPFVHAPKGGLLTLARLPLAAVEFTLYRSREVPYPLSLMDWLLHKGILATRLDYAGVSIVVLNTHLNANYGGNWDRRSSYTRSEAEQLRQLADIVRAQPPEALVVAAGDFNFPRDSWLYEE